MCGINLMQQASTYFTYSSHFISSLHLCKLYWFTCSSSFKQWNVCNPELTGADRAIGKKLDSEGPCKAGTRSTWRPVSALWLTQQDRLPALELLAKAAIFNLFHLLADINYENSVAHQKIHFFANLTTTKKNRYNFDSFILDGYGVDCCRVFYLTV